MSAYFIRMIELLSLEAVENEHYIYVALSTTTTEPVRIYWKIDAPLSRQLYMYCDFHGKSRYRLSLQAHLAANDTLIGGITKTYLTTSQRFDLLVCEEFWTHLKTLNTQTHLLQVLQLPYIFTPEQFEDVKIKKQLQALKAAQTAKATAQKDKPLSDLAKFIAASVIRAKRPAEAPVFTSHANNNAFIFPHLIHGSKAF